MATSLPTDTNELTAAWLGKALRSRRPDVQVSDVRIVSERGSTNHHVRLSVTYLEAAGLPDTIFCKMAPLDPVHRAGIGATGMGAREVRFYNEMAPSLPMRTPDCYFAESDPDGRFVLLFEDLAVAGVKTSDGTWGLSADLAASGLTDLARLHVTYEDPARLATVAPWIAANPAGNIEFTRPLLRQVIDEHRSILSDEYVAVGELYIAQPEAVNALWAYEPHTVVHGDAHLGNVFVDGDRVGFLDWGLLAVAPPMRDVSYFITLQLMADVRRANERELVLHYLDARAALGGAPITFEDAWRAHRVHAGYLVLASFLSLVPPYNGEDQRAFSDAFRNRAMEALDDLGSAEAMSAALA